MRLLIFFLALVSVLSWHSVSFPMTSNASQMELQAIEAYENANYEQALVNWQQALTFYQNKGERTSQARVLSNLSLTYQQLGKWSAATENIDRSFELLSADLPENFPVLAQAFNTQGSLFLALGKSEKALDSFERSEKYYHQSNSSTGVLRSQVNQAQALQTLGFYRRGEKLLSQLVLNRELESDLKLKIVALRKLGRMRRLLGDFDGAEIVLQQSLTLSRKRSGSDVAETLLNLGQNASANNLIPFALDYYQQALDICQRDTICFRSQTLSLIKLAQLRGLLLGKQWLEALNSWAKIPSSLEKLPVNQNTIYAFINLAQSLLTLRQSGYDANQLPSAETIASFLNLAITHAKTIEDQRAISYAQGELGSLYVNEKQWFKAFDLTQQALLLALGIDAPDLLYRWQWQLGRIYQFQGNQTEAIIAYTAAVNTLNIISNDLVAVNRDLQFSFRESVEPVYRELVSLLLAPKNVTQDNLKTARKVIESLQIAELNNFLQVSCYSERSLSLDNIINEVDQEAAVIYPIILEDRLEIILSLPQQPLLRFTTSVTASQLTETVIQLQKTLVYRSKKTYVLPAKKVYEWLINPLISTLETNKIKTLVFVLDGVLRNVPMAALFDGNNFLVEKYNIALTPGLQLLNSVPLGERKLAVLAAGLSEARFGFPPLDNVEGEIAQIQKQMATVVLLNDNFTENTLQQEIQYNSYPFIHVATHGQFSSNFDDTFILASDKIIKINDLYNILENRSPQINQAIELIVLSACETATGDERAALGLAGMSVRAGARSTLASLWSINDQATSLVMKYFYQGLASQRISKAEALRQAQLKLLKNRWYRHPFYWAPHVLLGNWI